MGNSKAAGALIFVALFWNGIVGLFDAAIIAQYAEASVAATSFEPVQARITASKVSSDDSEGGAAYSAEVLYEYSFEGQKYLGDRYSFHVMSTSARAFAERIIERYPVGETVTVYVDPDEPSEATLEVNADSFPAAVLLFLMPFNCIGLLLIVAAVSAFLQRNSDKGEEAELRARYLRVDTLNHVVFGRKRMSSMNVFLGATSGLSFLATFAVIVPFGFDAPMKVVLAAMLASLGAGSLAAYKHAEKGRSPDKFLHVDRQRGTFSFPANGPGVALESIQSILSEAEKTNLTINDVRQYKHTFEAETPGGVLKLFEVRSGLAEGDEILNLLRAELLRG